MPRLTSTEQAIATALRECFATWERGESASPDSRDLLYFSGRAIGIGTDHADISDVLADELDEYHATGPDGMGADVSDLARWIAGRIA